jgi:hypothetical protein
MLVATSVQDVAFRSVWEKEGICRNSVTRRKHITLIVAGFHVFLVRHKLNMRHIGETRSILEGSSNITAYMNSFFFFEGQRCIALTT